MKYIKRPSNQFIHDFKLPISATVVFIVLVGIMFGFRTLNKIALAGVLGSKTNDEYSKLLSTEINNKDEVNTENTKVSETNNDNTSNNLPFSISADPIPITAPAPSPGIPNSPPAPPQPFSSQITGFFQDISRLEMCKDEYGNNRPCRIYKFKSVVKTSNGPGTVNFLWQGNTTEIFYSGSLPVGAGEVSSNIIREFGIFCEPTSRIISIYFEVTSPTSSSYPTPPYRFEHKLCETQQKT